MFDKQNQTTVKNKTSTRALISWMFVRKSCFLLFNYN